MYKIFSEMIERIKKMTFKDWLIIILSVLLLLVFLEARMYRIRSEQQTVILQDSLTTYKNKAKEEYAAKNIYIQSAKELKKQNNELADEMKKLKDNPVVITKTKVVTKIVEVPMNSDSIGNSTAHHDTDSAGTTTSYKSLYWSRQETNNYYSISGRTDVRTDFGKFQTTLTSLEIPVNLTFDIIEKDKQLQFIGRTDNPYVSIVDMNGAVIDPQKSKVLKKMFPQKHWHIGIHGGYGFGLHDNTIILTPQLSLGLTYSLFSF